MTANSNVRTCAVGVEYFAGLVEQLFAFGVGQSQEEQAEQVLANPPVRDEHIDLFFGRAVHSKFLRAGFDTCTISRMGSGANCSPEGKLA